ncbi:MAG: DUF3592 domain-containing protein [Deltaproteobacteria bacterium]|nr:DUF3592 domain-containing protein [Deltaproteobacteria bacterium]
MGRVPDTEPAAGPYRRADALPRLAEAPRRLPRGLRARFAFGNPLSLIGWPVFGVGMILVWAVVLNSEVMVRGWDGQLDQVTGEVLVSEVTGTKQVDEGGPHYDSEWKVHYRYVAHDGRPRTSVSWGSTRLLARGVPVEVEVQHAHPERSRIKGLRDRRFAGGLVWLVLIPLGGLGLAVGGLFWGGRVLTLLGRGAVARARLVERRQVEQSRTEAGTPIYTNQLTFEFRAADGELYRRTIRTRNVDRFVDEAEGEQIVYHPMIPSYARLMDELPGRPRIGEDGQLGSPDQWGYVVLVLPILMVWSHLLYFVFWWLS